jgi:hypothetical protein
MTTPNPNLPHNKHRRHQRGAALLILMLLVMLGLITLFTFRMDRKGPELNADRQTAAALAQAKEALLGRAAKDNDPGTLPCPDFDGDGLLTVGTGDYSGLNCASYLGWLPWGYLDTGELRDGNNGKLWYFLSLNFKDNNNNPVPSTSGTLSILGTNPLNNLVAIIIAPGRPVPGQTQPATDATGYAQYLESYVNSTTLNAAPQSSTYNDRFLPITWRDLFNVVTARAARSFAKELPPAYPISGWVPNTGEWAIGNNPFTAWANNTVTVYTAPVAAGSPATLQFPPCAAIYLIQRTGLTYQVSRNGTC